MFDARLPHVPDDWTVWAFSDSHGVTSALRRALGEAGLIDSAGHWAAPPRTALIGCGDYIDRGGDIAGTVELLRRLQQEAATGGGAALLARGNHEAMPLMASRGDLRWLDTWLHYGGQATLGSFCGDAASPEPEPAIIERMEACQPGIFDWFASLYEAVRWRGILFVHGGLAPEHGLDHLGITTDEHLWVRSGFFDTPWEAEDFDLYRAAGIERVVFGHTPQWQGPTFHHEGRSLGIDTNAVGNPRVPEHAVQELTLIGLPADGTFEDLRIIRVPTSDAPDRMDPAILEAIPPTGP